MDVELHSRPKRKRASNPKVRSGCSTCKLRRVKCDEAKPACDRCVKSQRTCEYPELKPIIRRCKVQPQPRPVPSSLVHRQPARILPRSLSISVPGTDKDHLFFHRYQEQVSHDLGGTFGLTFYKDAVLQDCHVFPTIWHLSVAVAAIATSVTYKRSDTQRQDHYQFALRHVNTALRSLRQSLEENAGNARMAVSACGLLCAFETIQGNYQNSRNQLVSGRKVFDKWRTGADTALGYSLVSTTFDFELWEMFRRLELNFSLYAAHNPIDDVVFAGDKDVTIFENLHFTTAAQGRWLSYGLLYTISKFQRNAGLFKCSHWPEPLPILLRQEGEDLLRKIEIYLECFRLVMRDYEHTPFYLIYLTGFNWCRISINTVMATEECMHDQYLDTYQQIISDAKLLQEVERISVNATTSLMDVELSLPLFCTGARCRDAKLRRDAISILQTYPRRQSLWNSDVLVVIIEWIIGIEEADIDIDGCIPESKRIRTHTLKWRVNDDRVHVEAIQGSADTDLILHKAIIQLM